MNIEIYKCPNCGANIDLSKEICDYCGVHYKIKTYQQLNGIDSGFINKIATLYSNKDNIVDSNLCAGLCYLKLKQYPLALLKFEKAIEHNTLNDESYYYKALAILQGRKPFLLNRTNIENAENCIKSAIAIKNTAKYFFLWAIIRYDYYYRKAYNVSPDYKDLFDNAISLNLRAEDVKEIYEILGFEWEKIFNY